MRLRRLMQDAFQKLFSEGDALLTTGRAPATPINQDLDAVPSVPGEFSGIIPNRESRGAARCGVPLRLYEDKTSCGDCRWWDWLSEDHDSRYRARVPIAYRLAHKRRPPTRRGRGALCSNQCAPLCFIALLAAARPLSRPARRDHQRLARGFSQPNDPRSAGRVAAFHAVQTRLLIFRFKYQTDLLDGLERMIQQDVMCATRLSSTALDR